MMKRRNFIQNTALAAAGITTAKRASAIPFTEQTDNKDRPLKKTYRAAAIGSTGNGDFGHRLDKVFIDLPGVQFVAIADDNPEGLQAAGKRNGVTSLYTDYREMLQKEEIDIVSVGMRHSVLHEDIIVYCADAGKHIYSDKPLAPDLAAVDRILAACRRNDVKIAVAMQNRVSPQVLRALEIVREGGIGKILSVRGRGKEDHRGGGEDLLVLGYHIFDLMRLFCGDPEWCFADVRHDGRPMQKSDAWPGREPNGLVAGDWLAAMYGFPNGIHGYFESHRGLKSPDDRFNLEIYGSEGVIAMRSVQNAMMFQGPVFNPAKPHRWQRILVDDWDRITDRLLWGNRKLVLDLLHAAEDDREPVCSGEDGRWALEMVMSVYASHFKGARMKLPLEQRQHPLL